MDWNLESIKVGTWSNSLSLQGLFELKYPNGHSNCLSRLHSKALGMALNKAKACSGSKKERYPYWRSLVGYLYKASICRLYILERYSKYS